MNFFEISIRLFRELRKNPKSIYFMGKAFIRGCLYSVFYRLFRRNVKIRLPFFIYYRVEICGQGSVFIDRGCSVFPNTFDGLTIVTLSSNAQVWIGKGCDLGGVTIRCHKRVEIGEHGLFANCLIQDTLFSVARPGSSIATTNAINPREIYIGKSVWLAGQTLVLPGSKIGDESVLSVGGVCSDHHIPERHLAVGNPVKNSLDIDKISNFFGNR